MKRSRIKQVSDKRRAVNKQRREFVERILGERLFCEAGPIICAAVVKGDVHVRGEQVCRGDQRSTEVHEPKTRARNPGSDTILDEENAVALCSACHRWIHDNVGDATRIGLLVSCKTDDPFPKILPRRR